MVRSCRTECLQHVIIIELKFESVMQMRAVFCNRLAQFFNLGVSRTVLPNNKNRRLEFSDGKAIENIQLEVGGHLYTKFSVVLSLRFLLKSVNVGFI